MDTSNEQQTASAAGSSSSQSQPRGLLSQTELHTLLHILQERNTTLREIATAFRKAFDKEATTFRPCCALALLIEDNLLTPHQRLVALFLLLDQYNDPNEPNKVTPFGKTVIDCMERDSSQVEKYYLINIVTNAKAFLSAASSTTTEIVKAYEQQIEESAQLPSTESFKKRLRENYPRLTAMQDSEVRPIVLDPVGPTAVAKLASFIDDGTKEAKRRALNVPKSAQLTGSMPEYPLGVDDLPSPRTNLNYAFLSTLGIPGQKALDPKQANNIPSYHSSTDPAEIIRDENAERYGETDLQRTDSLSVSQSPRSSAQGVLYEDQTDLLNVQGFSPPFARPTPPLLAVDDSEYSWLLPLEPAPLIWDNGSFEDKRDTIRRLLLQALKEPLDPNYLEKLKSLLEPEAVSTIQATVPPESLPNLVENNPWATIPCLQQLLKASQADDYLLALVNMEMSLHSMEVVNRLTAEAQVPKEFLHMYISNCISTCENTQDPYLQTRLVRLVCVFLQSLLRNKIIDVSDLMLEVQAFCINFSRIKEANALYKLINSMSP
eukprot:gb/GECG01012956.1/.p1 GENE.gb/GECG01012956.1/~~gb/GECG01012956.1/.p1  ORF type:complete len:548 (+),score=67.79 gb/GECG01012956.1/:1-1644(+)